MGRSGGSVGARRVAAVVAASLLLLVGTGAGVRPAAASGNGADPSPCAEATTTLAMGECLAREVGRAERRLERVLAAAEARLERERSEAWRPAAIEPPVDLAAGQRLWLAYRQAHGGAIASRWRGASLRPVVTAECLLRLTRQRSHELWSAFLTFPDGTPPLLPDPTAPEPTAAPAPQRPR